MTNDQLFAVLTIVVMAGTIGWSLLHFVAKGRSIRSAGSSGGEATVRRLGLIERAAYVLLTLTAIALAVSGMAPSLLFGEMLSGYLLMAHVMAGGVFMFFLLLTALLGAGGAAGPDGKFAASQRCSFWVILALGVGTALTMMFSMLPIFGPHGLEVLRELHRYMGLAIVAVGYWHIYQTMFVRRGRMSWLVSGKVSSEWARQYWPQRQTVE